MTQLHRLLIADARAILKGHVISYTYKKGFLGNYFLVEDVKKKGTSFIVIGTGHGVKSQTEMTASEIIWLSRHRELETTFKHNDKECYKKYVLC